MRSGVCVNGSAALSGRGTLSSMDVGDHFACRCHRSYTHYTMFSFSRGYAALRDREASFKRFVQNSCAPAGLYSCSECECVLWNLGVLYRNTGLTEDFIQ